MPVERSGAQWRDVPERARTHSTAPTARELKDGPVERAPADVQGQEQAPMFSRSASAAQALPEVAQQLKDTERAYGGRAAYDRAKAAGKTKLAYGQWVQVRTPNFKAWFGDWQALAAQQRLDAMEPVRVRVPGEWHGLGHAELREKLALELDRMVREKVEIEHPELGAIRVGRAGAKKSQGAARDPAKSLIVADIKALIPAAIYARSEVARGDGPDIAGYSTLLARVEVAGVPLVASFTVRHQSDGQWYYNAVALHDAKEKAQDSYGRPDQQAGSSVAPIAGLSDFVRRPLARVNPAEVSKVVDPSTGEPLVVYHGTGADFSVFDDKKRGSNTREVDARQGFFLSSSTEIASEYAQEAVADGGANIMPAYVSLQNPLAIDEGGRDYDAARFRDYILQAKEQGHDGVLLRSSGDGMFKNGLTGDTVIALRPEQIKSAIGNNGNFSSSDPDIRRSFAGQQAATADQHALASAQQRLEAGEDAEAVRRDTGWHRGADGKWRFEISDADARLKVGHKGVPVSQLLAGVAQMQAGWYRLADLLDHPALFAAYPDLAAMPVKFMPGSAMGQADGRFNPSNGTLYLHEDLAQRQALSTLLHEVQHGIQNIEGFATGGSPSQFAGVDLAAQAALDRINERLNSGEYDMDEYDALLQQKRDILSRAGTASPRELYRRLAGEVEARNTQARQKLTDEQRSATPPGATADVADTDVIVTFNGQEMASAPMPANAAGFDFDAMRRTVLGEGAAAAPSGATITQVAGAIRRAYGSLLDKLQAKGLVTLVQSEDEAVEAAAQARAAKTGEALERARASLMASVQSSRSPMKSVEANIRRGREALARALDGKTSVHRAMYRNGLGWVDFVWGDEGVVKPSGKTKGAMGLAHIVEARQRKDGMTDADAVQLLDRLVRAIASGREERRHSVGPSEQMVVEHDGVQAILTKRAGSNAWLLSGWELKNPDALRAGNAAPEATPAEPTAARPGRGAGFAQIMNVGGLDIKRSTSGAIEGFFDPVSGQSFLVADGLSEATAPGTLMHEVGIHMAADGTLAPLFERAQALVQEGAATSCAGSRPAWNPPARPAPRRLLPTSSPSTRTHGRWRRLRCASGCAQGGVGKAAAPAVWGFPSMAQAQGRSLVAVLLCFKLWRGFDRHSSAVHRRATNAPLGCLRRPRSQPRPERRGFPRIW